MRLCYKRQHLLLSVLSLSSKITPEIRFSAVSATAAISVVSILSESCQLPPKNEFVAVE